MKYQIRKDKKKRSLVQKNELKRLFLKYCMRNEDSSINWKHSLRLSKLSSNSSKIRVKNRCIYSNRSRGVYRHFRLSRIVLRDLGSLGQINGLKKSSW